MSTKKIALITGSNRGIGFETARQLGKKGFHVFLSARNKEAGEEAAARLQSELLSTEFILMDVGDIESIKQAAALVKIKVPKIDVLINNAGILSKEDDNLLTVPAALVYETININALGALFVAQHFASLLQRGSRIINISSGGGSMTDDIGGWAPVYCISKSAMNAITRQLAYYFKSHGVSVNAVCPGWVRTRMGGRGAPRDIEKGSESAVWLATDAPASHTGKFFRDKRQILW